MISGRRTAHASFWLREVVAFVAFLTIAPTISASPDVYLDGYFRVRGRLYDNLALNRSTDAEAAPSAYFDQRLRVAPELRVNQYLSVFGQVDILPNLVWGTNPERLSIYGDYLEPVGQSQSFRVPEGTDALQVRQAWGEAYTPFGRLKFGRTGMKVGAGVYFSDGSGFDSDYGDIADRIQFLTRLGPVFVLVGTDMIFEGYNDESYDAQALAAAIAYRSELLSGSFYTYYQNDRTLPSESSLALESGTDGSVTELHMGTFTFDLWGQGKVGPVDLELEAIVRYGTGDMILEDAETGLAEQIQDGTLLQYGGMAKAAWNRKSWRLGFELGLASGDATDDSKFTTFTFDRDYHIAFMLFRTPLPARARISTDDSNQDIFDSALTGNAISNAFYLVPSARFQIIPNLSARLSGTFAWAREPSAATNYAEDYGSEIDLEVSSLLFDKFSILATGGIFLPGDAFADNNDFGFGGEVRALIEF